MQQAAVRVIEQSNDAAEAGGRRGKEADFDSVLNADE